MESYFTATLICTATGARSEIRVTEPTGDVGTLRPAGFLIVELPGVRGTWPSDYRAAVEALRAAGWKLTNDVEFDPFAGARP